MTHYEKLASKALTVISVKYCPNALLNAEECAIPLAHSGLSIGGTGGEVCASDSSGLVNSMEERSLVSHGPKEVHCTLQQKQRERIDSHFTAAQKL